MTIYVIYDDYTIHNAGCKMLQKCRETFRETHMQIELIYDLTAKSRLQNV